VGGYGHGGIPATILSHVPRYEAQGQCARGEIP
jgi:hypothetical protein